MCFTQRWDKRACICCCLLLMSIEREIMRAVHFDDVIEDCLNEGSQGVAASVYALQSSP